MSEDLSIPAAPVSEQDIADWYVLHEQLSEMKAREMELRKRICAARFKDPREGTNNLPIDNGYVMKMIRTVDRKLEIGEYQARQDIFNAARIPLDIIEMKPQLKISVYRELTEEQRQLFDHCLIIKDGAPQLDIVKPKRAVK